MTRRYSLGPGRPRSAVWVVALVIGVALSGGFAATGGVASGSGSAHGTSVLGGLFSTHTVQTVGGSDTEKALCASPTDGYLCSFAVMGLTYIPDPQLVFVTTGSYLPANVSVTEGPEGFEGLNATTLSVSFEGNLTCNPGSPFYPGSGTDVYVPCLANPFLFVVDAATGAILSNISTPFPVRWMTYDASDGTVYAVGGGSDAIAGISASARSATVIARVSSANFSSSFVYGPEIAYDGATGRLLVLTSDGVLAVDPATGSTSPGPVVALPYRPCALAVDPSAPLVFLSLWSGANSVLVYNATTFAETTSLSLTTPYPAGGNDSLTQIAFDPTHGDAYLAGEYISAVNLQTLTVVGTVGDNNGVGISSLVSWTYDPLTDTLLGSAWWGGPAFAFPLVHGSSTTYELLWLSLGWAITAIVLAVAVGVTIVVVRRLRRPPTEEAERAETGHDRP